MSNDLIVPEILLIDKLEEMDNTLAPSVWEDMREKAKHDLTTIEFQEKHISEFVKAKRKMVIQDFVEKAIEKPMLIKPEPNDEVKKQLYRLHMYCCQRVINKKEIRLNPLLLPSHALMEMRLALTAIMISYRLITPSCPYRWDRTFFEKNIIVDKNQDGDIILNFKNIDVNSINNAINDEIITDWMIYRTYDGAGIKTLMDTKNNLMELPNYERGGHPAAEFSRFQRKWKEKVNKKEEIRNDALDLEFRKTLIQSVAQQTATELLSSGISPTELLEKICTSKNLTSLMEETKPLANKKSSGKALKDHSKDRVDFIRPQTNKALPKQKDQSEIEDYIDELLDEE
ncbi:MAG: hypothetical protein IJE43_11185 [Alphaproteobacteria bacterium]|nr:hypothetical protein [Alphaproteobacteria bacterium]